MKHLFITLVVMATVFGALALAVDETVQVLASNYGVETCGTALAAEPAFEELSGRRWLAIHRRQKRANSRRRAFRQRLLRAAKSEKASLAASEARRVKRAATHEERLYWLERARYFNRVGVPMGCKIPKSTPTDTPTLTPTVTLDTDQHTHAGRRGITVTGHMDGLDHTGATESRKADRRTRGGGRHKPWRGSSPSAKRRANAARREANRSRRAERKPVAEITARKRARKVAAKKAALRRQAYAASLRCKTRSELAAEAVRLAGRWAAAQVLPTTEKGLRSLIRRQERTVGGTLLESHQRMALATRARDELRALRQAKKAEHRRNAEAANKREARKLADQEQMSRILGTSEMGGGL